MTREDWLKEATLLIEQQILMEQNVNKLEKRISDYGWEYSANHANRTGGTQ